MKAVNLFGIFFLTMLLVASIAVAVPLRVDKLELNDVELIKDDVTRLNLERGDRFDLEVKLTGLDNSSNVEVEAFISGYEYADFEPLSATTHIFDIETGVSYIKKLSLALPDLMDRDNYKLRLLVSDRNGQSDIYNYNLKVDTARHSLAIKDVVLNPQNEVKSGRALLTTVRIKNMGQKTEEGIKIKASIPSIGVSAADYIEKLRAGESTTSEELYMRVPDCAAEGIYTMKVAVEFDEGYAVASTDVFVRVVKSDSCTASVPASASQNLPQQISTVTVGAETQDAVKGEGSAVYPVTISNLGTTSRAYIISVDGTAGWAAVSVSPSNLLTLNAGETRTALVAVSANSDASPGERLFTVSVKSGNEVIQNNPVKVNVVEGAGKNLKKNLEIALIVLVVLLIVVALVVGFYKMNKGNSSSGQYY